MQTKVKFLDRYNSLFILILSIVATVAAIISVVVSVQMQKDKGQLLAIDSLLVGQQVQLNTQHDELTEIRKQSTNLEDVDTGVRVEIKRLSDQLSISQQQQKQSLRNYALERKANIIRLKGDCIQFDSLLLIPGLASSQHDSSEFERKVNILENLLREEMKNPVVLEDTSILNTWAHFYNDIINCRIAIEMEKFFPTIPEQNNFEYQYKVQRINIVTVSSFKFMNKIFPYSHKLCKQVGLE